MFADEAGIRRPLIRGIAPVDKKKEAS